MTTIATAAVLRGIDQAFAYERVRLDAPRAEELLVRIAAVGLCHTDLAVRSGRLPAPTPIVLGHEGAGTVEAVGSAVTDFAPGDRVVLSFASCGQCDACRDRRPAHCVRFGELNLSGARADGSGTLSGSGGETIAGAFFGQSSLASHALTSARNAVHLPDELPFELAAPLGCGVQTGAGAVFNTLRIPAGASVIVAGVGSVGLAAVMAARAAGATTIIAIDLLEPRLRLAHALGATHTIDARDNCVERILNITGIGAEFAIDTTAEPSVISSLLTATRPGAGIALLGIGRSNARIPLAFMAGKRIFGGIEGDAEPRAFLPRLLELHRAGRFPFERLVTLYRFDDLERAIADVERGATVKAVFTF